MTPGLSAREKAWCFPGSIFVLIEFVLLSEEAIARPILVDSAGTRYMPDGVATFSGAEFHFFVHTRNNKALLGYYLASTGRAPRVLARIEESQYPGGKMEVTRNEETGELTIKAAKSGTKFTLAWVVPQASVFRRSEFKLRISSEEPIVIDTLASARKIPLDEAIGIGHTGLVAQLLAEGTPVNAKNEYGSAPLHGPARNHWSMVELLLAKGADANVRDAAGATPLHRAAVAQYKPAAELLLASGANVNAQDNSGKTALHTAARNFRELAELLLDKGADVNAKDNDGTTPLHEAASGNNTKVAELLLAKGADVNAKDENGATPLHTAAATDHMAIAELLLVKGAEVNAKDNHGQTPLDLAKTDEMKALLRKYGAK
jgi:hypothetical protein